MAQPPNFQQNYNSFNNNLSNIHSVCNSSGTSSNQSNHTIFRQQLRAHYFNEINNYKNINFDYTTSYSVYYSHCDEYYPEKHHWSHFTLEANPGTPKVEYYPDSSPDFFQFPISSVCFNLDLVM